jgi:zinc/manganese transport system permease protein
MTTGPSPSSSTEGSLVDALASVVGSGFFASEPVRTALVIGTVSAVVSAVAGTFTVVRGQSFAGHSLADVGSAGGSAAYLVGANPLLGFVTMNLLAAGAMELIGVRRPRGRDVGTGIVLGASLGLAALFLNWDTMRPDAAGATYTVLFGDLFAVSSSIVPAICALGGGAVVLMTILYRPLLLSSVSPELAAARGIRVRLVGTGFLLGLALAVSLSAVTIGAILSTALLIGPASAALRVTRRTGAAIGVAVALGCAVTWLGILLTYESYYWSASHAQWPVSFFVVALCVVAYALCGTIATNRERRRARALVVGAT